MPNVASIGETVKIKFQLNEQKIFAGDFVGKET